MLDNTVPVRLLGASMAGGGVGVGVGVGVGDAVGDGVGVGTDPQVENRNEPIRVLQLNCPVVA